MYYFCVDFYSLILLFDELPSFLISDCSELSNYLTELVFEPTELSVKLIWTDWFSPTELSVKLNWTELLFGGNLPLYTPRGNCWESGIGNCSEKQLPGLLNNSEANH